MFWGCHINIVPTVLIANIFQHYYFYFYDFAHTKSKGALNLYIYIN